MEQFLKDIERRAFHMARMATGSRDDALDIVQDAMYKLVEKYSAKPADRVATTVLSYSQQQNHRLLSSQCG